MIRIVSTAKECLKNIERFEQELKKHPGLQERLSSARAWYAQMGDDGHWHFGPSKFVGYVGLDGEKYLQMAQELDGRRTEAQLRQWFKEVETEDPIFEAVSAELALFLAKYNKVPSVKMRINVLPNTGVWHGDEEEPTHPVPLLPTGPMEGSKDPEEHIVALLVAVARTLSRQQLKLLREQLFSE